MMQIEAGAVEGWCEIDCGWLICQKRLGFVDYQN